MTSLEKTLRGPLSILAAQSAVLLSQLTFQASVWSELTPEAFANFYLALRSSFVSMFGMAFSVSTVAMYLMAKSEDDVRITRYCFFGFAVMLFVSLIQTGGYYALGFDASTEVSLLRSRDQLAQYILPTKHVSAIIPVLINLMIGYRLASELLSKIKK